MLCSIRFRSSTVEPPETASEWTRDGTGGFVSKMPLEEATPLLEGLGLLGTGALEDGEFLAVVTLGEHGHTVTIGNAELDRAGKATFLEQVESAGWLRVG